MLHSIFRHLKLVLLTQFPASNDEKYFYVWEMHRVYRILLIYHSLLLTSTIYNLQGAFVFVQYIMSRCSTRAYAE